MVVDDGTTRGREWLLWVSCICVDIEAIAKWHFHRSTITLASMQLLSDEKIDQHLHRCRYKCRAVSLSIYVDIDVFIKWWKGRRCKCRATLLSLDNCHYVDINTDGDRYLRSCQATPFDICIDGPFVTQQLRWHWRNCQATLLCIYINAEWPSPLVVVLLIHDNHSHSQQHRHLPLLTLSTTTNKND